MSNEINTEPTTVLPSLKGINSVYFIGIGGMGMSAIARYFYSKGIDVTGYDKTPTDLTRELEDKGISIHYNEDVAAIPKNVDVVVYTPAVPQSHQELIYFRANGFKVVKRSDVLQAITNDSFNICVAGTHGKTTVSTLIAHILKHTGFGCNAFLGGISSNYNTNFWSSDNNVVVVEADEYDRSFLKLSPNIALITAMDADHLDIYGDERSMQDSFIQFGNKLKEDGLLLTKFGLRRIKEVKASRKLTYSLTNESADVYAANIVVKNGTYSFDVHLPGTIISNVHLNIGGMHNIENTVAAIAVAHQLEIDNDKIKEAIADFKGVRRRFEYIIAPQDQIEGAYVQPVFIDDYAHHPEELRALLKSVRNLFPQRKVTVIFQPHLYTRTRDFRDGFAESLSIADEVILLPIYPARELPIDGVSSEMILEKITAKQKTILNKDELLSYISNHVKNIDKEFGEVIITAGAGDIDAFVKPIKNIIEKP